jgi:uncharacterized protein YbaA (DUF1428 family)
MRNGMPFYLFSSCGKKSDVTRYVTTEEKEVVVFTYLQGRFSENADKITQKFIRDRFKKEGRERAKIFCTKREAYRAGKEKYPYSELSCIRITIPESVWKQNKKIVQLDDAVIVIAKFNDQDKDLSKTTLQMTSTDNRYHENKASAPTHRRRSTYPW